MPRESSKGAAEMDCPKNCSALLNVFPSAEEGVFNRGQPEFASYDPVGLSIGGAGETGAVVCLEKAALAAILNPLMVGIVPFAEALRSERLLSAEESNIC